MNSAVWISALLVAAAVLLFFLQGRGRTPARRETQSEAPPAPKRKRRKRKEGTASGVAAEGSGTATNEAGTLVAAVDVIPGKLVVRVFASTLNPKGEPVACWSYVSDGLWALGQKEIVFTVQRREGEGRQAFPRELLHFYALLHRLAGEGKLVDVGGVTSLGGVGLLGRSDFLGVVYTPPQAMPGVSLTAPSLIALIVTRGELEVAQAHGVVRLMSALGKHYRYFPTAPWTDRDREEICGPDAVQGSILPKAARLHLYSASVRQEGRATSSREQPGPHGLVDQNVTTEEQRIVLRLRPPSAAPLKEALAQLSDEGVPFLLTGPDPSAPACFSWEQGQKQPFAICQPGAPGTCIAGNFVSFLQQQAADGGVLFEDGFAMRLTDASWKRVKAALAGGEPLQIPAGEPGRMGLEIVWLPALDPDFADPDESHAPEGWGAFGGGVESSTPAHLKSITLLTLEPLLERRVEVNPLSAYIDAIKAEVESTLGDAAPGPGQDLALVCEVRPGEGRTFRFAVRPGEPGPTLDGLRERLMGLTPPAVVGPVRFQLNFQLHGGGGGQPERVLH